VVVVVGRSTAGASVVDRGSTITGVASVEVAAGVDSMGVSILGASSETLVAFPAFSGDFERPKDLNWEVSRRTRLSPRSVTAGLNSASSVSGAGTSSAGVASSVVSGTAGVSPFVTGAGAALSFLGSMLKMLERFDFSLTSGVGAAAGSSVAAGVSSVTAGVSVEVGSAAGVSSVAGSLAAGSGDDSLAEVLDLKSPAKPVKDLRFSFFSGSRKSELRHGHLIPSAEASAGVSVAAVSPASAAAVSTAGVSAAASAVDSVGATAATSLGASAAGSLAASLEPPVNLPKLPEMRRPHPFRLDSSPDTAASSSDVTAVSGDLWAPGV
jgi:hypothetical protein